MREDTVDWRHILEIWTEDTLETHGTDIWTARNSAEYVPLLDVYTTIVTSCLFLILKYSPVPLGPSNRNSC
jgi:hypothetical protein